MSPRILTALIMLAVVGSFALGAAGAIIALGAPWRRRIRLPLGALLLAGAIAAFAQLFPLEAAFNREVRARAAACIETGGIPLGRFSECERS